MFSKLAQTAQQVITESQNVARAHGATEVGTEHLLAALLKLDGHPAQRFLATCGLSYVMVEDSLLGPRSESQRKGKMPFAPAVKRILEQAQVAARELGQRHIDAEHCLLGLMKHEEDRTAKFLQAHGITRDRFLSFLSAAQPAGETASGTRGNVISVRLDDASLAKIDALVQADVFKSRSEAAHFLIKKGILAQAALIDQVTQRLAAIRQIQDELKALFKDEADHNRP